MTFKVVDQGHWEKGRDRKKVTMMNNCFGCEGKSLDVCYSLPCSTRLTWPSWLFGGGGGIICPCAGQWDVLLRTPRRNKGFILLLLEVLLGDSPQLSVLSGRCLS